MNIYDDEWTSSSMSTVDKYLQAATLYYLSYIMTPSKQLMEIIALHTEIRK